jgi:ABC-2 type transport system ATP-binding protein
LEKIKIENLNVAYGRNQVLFDINLEIDRGMFGLLGRNGAGKSTLLKALVTLLPIKKGKIEICDVPVSERRKVRSMVGYLPQDFNMYPNMTVAEALEYLAVLSEMKSIEIKNQVKKVLKLVNLWEDRNVKVKALSGGMKRRLGIAQAIVHNPKVLIVDEPTAGLDPEERIRFRNLLANLAENKIVVLSTHIVEDIESTCNHLAVLNNGHILFNGEVNNLVESARGCTYRVQVSKGKLHEYQNRYVITSQQDYGDYVDIKILSKGKVEEGFIPCEPNIEDGYLNLLYDIGGGR